MSELKVYHCNEWHNEYTEFYLKSEADEELAKLNRQVKFLQTTHSSCNECNKCADGMGRVFDEYLDELKKDKAYLLEHTTEVINSQERVISRQKYKRCLAMAEWCDTEVGIADIDGDYEDMQWYQKWYEHWLKLAKKFKEAKLPNVITD